MYIGPWQEYKLARILQLKDKVDQEEKQANQLEANTSASVSNKGNFNMDNNKQYANSEGFKQQNYMKASYQSENGHKMDNMSEQGFNKRSKGPLKPLSKRANRGRSHNAPKPENMKYQYPSHIIKQANAGVRANNFIRAKGGKSTSGSPTSNNTNYSSKVVRSTSNSFKPMDTNSQKSWHNMPSTRTLGAGSNYETKSYATDMLAEMRRNNFYGNFNKNNINRVIEVTYDKWNRFENFVKFATKKEIKDRLKEVDPPPVEHYVDGDVVYKIKEMGQGRPPRIIKKPLVSKHEIKKQNKERVNKMREVYGLQANQQNMPIPNQMPIQKPQITKPPFEYHEQTSHQSNSSFEEDHSSKQVPFPSSQIDPKVEILPKSLKQNQDSLYSFYQNIIDKNNDNSYQQKQNKFAHPNYQVVKPHNNLAKTESISDTSSVKESPSISQKSSKFKNAGRDIVHSSPHTNLDLGSKLEKKGDNRLDEIIEEDIKENLPSIPQNAPSLSPNMNKTKTQGFDESDQDGLINWALNLPDELSHSHSSQFYKKPNK